MPYYADVDDTNTVTRVVVAPTITWVRANLATAGVWVKTTNDLGSDQYPGPSWAYDPGSKVFTAPATPDDPPPDGG